MVQNKYAILIFALVVSLSGTVAIAQSLEDVNQYVREKDFSRAFRLCLRLARKNSDKEVQYKLAAFYRNGTGVQQNNERALFWFKKSAMQGYARAQYQLGVLYQNGIGVPVSRETAAFWYKKAVAKKYRRAGLALKKLNENNDASQSRGGQGVTQQLVSKIKQGRLSSVRSLVKKGANINVVDEQGRSLLHYAVTKRDIRLLSLLLSLKIDSNIRDNGQMTALMLAVENQSRSVVRELLTVRGNVNYKNERQQTALSIAQKKGYSRIEKMLLARGAKDFNKLSRQTRRLTQQDLARQREMLITKGPFKGWTPLMVAVWSGDKVLFKKLLRSDNTINAVDKDGYTALIRAAWKGRLSMLKSLLSEGADINHQSGQKLTALMVAAREGHISIVNYLVRKKANVSLVDLRGQTALHFASRAGVEKIANILSLSDGHIVNVRRKDGKSAIMIAANRGYKKVLVTLLKHGANPFLVDNRNQNALWYALMDGHIATAKVLPLAKFDINKRNADGNLLLTEMVVRNKARSVRLLIDAGADINATTIDGDNALMVASRVGNEGLARYFLTKKPDVNLRNRFGNTALMLAAEKGNRRMTELLLKHGAKLRIRNKNKYTAEELARHAGYERLAKYLEKHGKKKWLGIF